MSHISKFLLKIILYPRNNIKKPVFISIVFKRKIKSHLNTIFAFNDLYTLNIIVCISQLFLDSIVEMTALLLKMRLHFRA